MILSVSDFGSNAGEGPAILTGQHPVPHDLNSGAFMDRPNLVQRVLDGLEGEIQEVGVAPGG